MASWQKTHDDLTPIEFYFKCLERNQKIKTLVVFVLGGVVGAFIPFDSTSISTTLTLFAGLIAAQGIIFGLLVSQSQWSLRFSEEVYLLARLNQEKKTEFQEFLKDHLEYVPVIGAQYLVIVALAGFIGIVLTGAFLAAKMPAFICKIMCMVSLGVFSVGIEESFSTATVQNRFAWSKLVARREGMSKQAGNPPPG